MGRFLCRDKTAAGTFSLFTCRGYLSYLLYTLSHHTESMTRSSSPSSLPKTAYGCRAGLNALDAAIVVPVLRFEAVLETARPADVCRTYEKHSRRILLHREM